MAKKNAKSPIIQDDENVTIKLLDTPADNTTTDDAEGDGVLMVRPGNVEKIKAIIQCEDSIKFYRDTIADLKKTLATDMDVDAGFVSELIGIVKKEMDPEHGGDVINKKTKILDAADQCVVLYPNVEVKASVIAAAKDAAV